MTTLPSVVAIYVVILINCPTRPLSLIKQSHFTISKCGPYQKIDRAFPWTTSLHGWCILGVIWPGVHHTWRFRGREYINFSRKGETSSNLFSQPCSWNFRELIVGWLQSRISRRATYGKYRLQETYLWLVTLSVFLPHLFLVPLSASLLQTP